MKKLTGGKCLLFVLAAFAGIGIEIVLAFMLEPAIYGAGIKEWSVAQNILHWTITCAAWCTVCYLIIRTAKNKYGLDLMDKGAKVKPWQWILIVLFVILSLVLSYIDWEGSKVIKEFHSNGWLKFIFQYIYYCFEVALVALILVFGQKAFEAWFHNPNIPYGGIIVALTWGLGHFFTKDISTGIYSTISGLAFGSIYLLVNRDIKKAYMILWLMFVL